jgi:hypothetical protein
MKTRLLRLFIVLAAVTVVCLGTTPAFAEEPNDPVTIEKDRILIPGANITEKDQRDLNAILAQYDKSLYKLKSYAKGKANKTQGTLSDTAIDKATAARAAVHAKDSHFSGWTLQAGFTSNQDISGRTSSQNKAGFTSNQDISGRTSSQNKPGNTSNQDKPGTTSNQDITSVQNGNANARRKAQELVKRLTPILRKYTKTQSTR